MQQRIQQLTAELQALSARSEQEVEDLRIKYISKKGLVSQLFDEFKSVPNEEKRQVGQLLNALKTLATDKINELRASLSTGGDDSPRVVTHPKRGSTGLVRLILCLWVHATR